MSEQTPSDSKPGLSTAGEYVGNLVRANGLPGPSKAAPPQGEITIAQAALDLLIHAHEHMEVVADASGPPNLTQATDTILKAARDLQLPGVERLARWIPSMDPPYDADKLQAPAEAEKPVPQPEADPDLKRVLQHALNVLVAFQIRAEGRTIHVLDFTASDLETAISVSELARLAVVHKCEGIELLAQEPLLRHATESLDESGRCRGPMGGIFG